MNERPTFGSLFAGIGGIDLGLERAGWTCRWQVEWDAYCQRVLAKHWPDVPRYGDITEVDWSRVEPVDLIAGGFPCQPVSVAGKRGAQADDRWLWPEFARTIRALRPRYVLVENVPNLLAVVDGRAFGEVIGDLAALGYDAEWDCIPARAVGAPHLRNRVWIVAHRAELGRPVADTDNGGPFDPFRAGWDAARDGGSDVADTESLGCELWQAAGERPGRFTGGGLMEDTKREGLEGHECPVMAGSDDGRQDSYPSRPGRWATEPDVGRVAHGVPARVDRLRGLGNAVVPQVVEVIGAQLLRAVEMGL